MSILHASNHTWQKLFNMNSINNNNNFVNKYSNSKLRENEIEFTETKSSYNWDKCVQLRENDADIDTKSEFAKFEFEVSVCGIVLGLCLTFKKFLTARLDENEGVLGQGVRKPL